MQEALNIDGRASVTIGDQERLVAREAQQIFLLKAVAEAGHEGDVGGRGRAQIQNLQVLLARNATDELAKAGRATTDFFAGGEIGIRRLPRRTE